MQMIYAPSHIKKYVQQIQGRNKFFSDDICGEFTFAYEISCNCGNKEFDEDAITWCQIYLYDIASLQSIMIVDDETA
jgi:hypothetical protein